MKKFFIFSLIASLLYFGIRFMLAAPQQAVQTGPRQESVIDLQQATSASYYSPTDTPMPISTLEPSATIGYQATAVSAQQTADAANVIMAQITAESEQRLQERLAWTATIDAANIMIAQWTATAAPSSVPATATQAVLDRQLAAYQVSVQAGQLTATKEAPTQIAAMATAQAQADLAWWYEFALVCLYIAIAAFLIALVVLVGNRIRQEASATVVGSEDESKDTVKITLHRGTEIYSEVDHLLIPCSIDQLRIMAYEINLDPSLAINRWDKVKNKQGGMLFPRAQFAQICFFLVTNGLAYRTPKHEVILTPEGEEFFETVLNENVPPLQFAISPEFTKDDGKINHDHDNHEHDNGGGVAKTVVLAAEGGA